MLKKLALLAMAVGTLVAFAVPAAAGAAELTNEKEEAVETGTTVTAVSGNTITTANTGAVLGCAEVKIVGEVTNNSGGDVKIENMAVTTSDPCSVNGIPIMHISAQIATLTLSSSGSYADGVTFVSTITNAEPPTVCHFVGNGASGTGQSIPINVSGGGISIPASGLEKFNLTGSGSAGCPTKADTSGSFSLSGEGESYTVDP